MLDNTLHLYLFLTCTFSFILGLKTSIGVILLKIGKKKLGYLFLVSCTATVVFMVASLKGVLRLIGG